MEIITLREDYISVIELAAAAGIYFTVYGHFAILDDELCFHAVFYQSRKLYDGDVVCYNGNEIQIKK